MTDVGYPEKVYGQLRPAAGLALRRASSTPRPSPVPSPAPLPVAPSSTPASAVRPAPRLPVEQHECLFVFEGSAGAGVSLNTETPAAIAAPSNRENASSSRPGLVEASPLTQLMGASSGRQVFEVSRFSSGRRGQNLRSVPMHARVAITPPLLTATTPARQMNRSISPMSARADKQLLSARHGDADTSGDDTDSSSDDDTWATVSDSRAKRLVAESSPLRAEEARPRPLSPAVWVRMGQASDPASPPRQPQATSASATTAPTRPKTTEIASVIPYLKALPHYSTSNILLETPFELLGVPLPMIQWEFERQLLFHIIRSNAGGLLHHSLMHLWQNGVTGRPNPAGSKRPPVSRQGGGMDIRSVAGRLFSSAAAHFEASSPLPGLGTADGQGMGCAQSADDGYYSYEYDDGEPAEYHPLFDFDLE
jgi:hypothetical protein